MDNFVEFLYPRSDTRSRSARYAESRSCQPGTVDSSIWIQDFSAEAAHHFFMHRQAGLHQFLRDSV